MKRKQALEPVRSLLVQIPILLTTSYLTLEKLLNLFKPISLLQNGFNVTYSIVFPNGMIKSMCCMKQGFLSGVVS